MYFRNYRLSKTWLDQYLKRAISEDPSTVNMVNGPKDLWNLHDCSFIIFFHHSEGKWLGLYLPCWSLKSKGGFGNTLTTDYKYPVPDCENLPFPIQMQLS